MPDKPMPVAHCTSQYNVGVLDVVGVTVVWLTVFRCGEKLVAALMVFAGLYDMIFTVAKDSLYFMFLGICCFIPLPDVALISASAVAITYGGQMRVLGIAALVIFAVFSLPFCNTPYHDETSTYIAGPLAIKYTILYPMLLACFITIIVKDHHQWTPRPQTKLEQYLLIAKIISGTGAVDVFAAVFKLIRMRACDSLDDDDNPRGLPDLETGIFWWGLKTSSVQEFNRPGLHVHDTWSQRENAPRTFTESLPLSELERKLYGDEL
ncbi:hypothetical protein BG015_004668 [Linnemannia schmuckeri]|uniref:Uncharacterized protein n=1 Tax=Linnemannia schmuckeri TaxID=64567 RepID=A0A9P5VCX6_9FUNG|nr:hypothetical protein BG015_004668 [Linnemannia schmuckeri]